MTIPVLIDDRGGLAHPASVVPQIVFSLGVDGTGECPRNSAVERAAAYYLLGREPVSDVGVIPDMISEDPSLNAEAITLWRSLRGLARPQALARVTAVRDAIAACRDSTGLLTR